jgi:hypothetical protein
MPVLLLLGGVAGAVYTTDFGSFADLDAVTAMLPGSGCTIKGNVSIETGERIYHRPGQRYYAETRISPEHGERWFCSETDARRAGWRRSKV